MKLDILAIGVHPDDVELGCAGSLLKEKKTGKKTGIIDLTEGELGTRGTIETRYTEAAAAAEIIGAEIRENLKMRDGFFKNDEENQLKLIQKIRKYQPEVIFGNILNDRHPDHGRAGHLIKDAAFLSGLVKIETFDEQGNLQPRWRPKYVLHYLQDWFHEPDVLIDISEVFEEKMKSVAAYTTQFFPGDPGDGMLQTYISNPDFLESIVARARMLGKRIGVKYAEGFVSEKAIGINSINSLVLIET